MPHRINLTDQDYYKLMELKGKYGQKGLFGLLVEMDKRASKAVVQIVPERPKGTIVPEQDAHASPCMCGHTQKMHNPKCTIYGCKCEQYQEAPQIIII